MKLTFREAKESELPFLVKMLADDKLGSKREDASEPLNHSYLSAFGKIIADPNNELTVAVMEGEVLGMLQLTFIPYITHIGSLRCMIGGVRIHSKYRGQGFGTDFIKWGIERAKLKGCNIVQLTSDKQRPDAIRFYENHGFKATHEGLRLNLN